MRVSIVAGLLLGTFFCLPAQAAFTTITWTGKVTQVLDPSQGPEQVGDIINFSVTFDPSTITYVGNTVYDIDANTGLPDPMPDLRAATLAAPGASASVSLDGYNFTEMDDVFYGVDRGLGVGTSPLVFFDGDTFIGASLTPVSQSDGFFIQTDPVAYTLGFFPAQGLGGNADAADFGFYADIDTKDAVIAGAIPEPSAWVMAIAGFGVLGTMLRYRARKPAMA